MKVGVLLAGCGVQDGSEIYEAVLTILALERGGATVVAMAPDTEQAAIVNHYTGEDVRMETRGVLTESARIVRGKISSLKEISAHEIDALIIPGGYGVVKNLCSYAVDGARASVNEDVQRIIRQVNGLGKPIGAICVGPVLVALALSDKHVELTIGSDAKMTQDLEGFGATHVTTQVDEIHFDPKNKLVTTAAFMLAHTASEAAPGISKLVNKVLELAHEIGPGHLDDTATTTVYTAGVPS